MVHKTLLAFLLSLLAISCSRGPANSTEPSSGEPPRIASVDVVQVTPQEATITRGESGTAVIPIKISAGYHVNANPPTYSYLKPTEIELQPSDGITVEFLTYPDPVVKTFAFAEKPLAVYEGDTIIKATLKADKSSQPGKHNLSAKLRVQACDDKVCYAPGVRDVTIPVNIK